MKTFFYLIAFFCFCIQLNTKAQTYSYQLEEVGPDAIVKKYDCDGSKPVYYNFTRRKLYNHNKMELNPKQFLEMCRRINDPAIQDQIERYNQLTSNKKKIIVAMIVTGVVGYIGMIAGIAMTSSSSGYVSGAVIGVSAASLFIATPVLAISTAHPHQKRKAILFHDLPEAYNFYVTTQTSK